MILRSIQRVGVTTMIGATLLVTAALPAMGSSASPWSWRVFGTLSRHAHCTSASTPGSLEICSYRITKAPRLNGIETGIVKVHNSSSRTKCYGVSLSTSYMAGLHDFCVKPGATGEYRTSGKARHYVATQLSVFVTNGSKKKPIQPMNDSDHSSFVIIFSEKA